jgi:hypothetical protein
MKLTAFGTAMAILLLLALVVMVACAVIILEGIGTPWGVFGISAVIAIGLVTAFNLEGRRA